MYSCSDRIVAQPKTQKILEIMAWEMVKWQIETHEITEEISLFHVFFFSPGGNQSLQVITKSSQGPEMVETTRLR